MITENGAANTKQKYVLYLVSIIAVIAIAAIFVLVGQLNDKESEIKNLNEQMITAEKQLQEYKAADVSEADTVSKTGVSLVEAVYISSYANDENKNMNISNLNKVIIRDGFEEGHEGYKVITYTLQDEQYAKLIITVKDDILVDASIAVYSDNGDVLGTFKLNDETLQTVVDYAKAADSSENMYSGALVGLISEQETAETAVQ